MGHSISLSDIASGRAEAIDLLAACDARAAESTEFLCGISQILHVDPATFVAAPEWSHGHADRLQAEVYLGGAEYGHLAAGRRRLLSDASAR